MPKSFGDEIRKDISNEKKVDVDQPDTLQEAVALANNYHNLKPQSLNMAGGNKQNPDKTNPVVAAANTNPNKNAGKVVHTDPNKQPPKPWPNMAYCTHCKKWCSHSIDACFYKNKDLPNKGDDKKKEKGKKNPKVAGAATTYDDDAAVWGSNVNP